MLFSARELICASRRVNSPRKNSACMSTSESINNAADAGTPTKIIKRAAQSMVFLKLTSSFCASLFDRLGKITVPIATPIKPSGNSLIRSAAYNQETEPPIINEANTVLSSKLIWVTETPKIAGSINFKIRRTPSCWKSIFGATSSFCCESCGSCINNCSKPAIATE